jgi:hypothetical protein
VDPHEFLVDQLRGRSPELADFVTTLPYWPIGADDYNGRSTPAEIRAETHDELFRAYVHELSDVLASVRQNHGTHLPGLQRVSRDEARLLSTDPRVISVYRKYFLACDQLNRKLEGGSQISPIVFTTEMLMGSHDDLFDVMVALPYSPVGLDENDRFV